MDGGKKGFGSQILFRSLKLLHPQGAIFAQEATYLIISHLINL